MVMNKELKNVIIPALFVLAGAIVGALGTVIAAYIPVYNVSSKYKEQVEQVRDSLKRKQVELVLLEDSLKNVLCPCEVLPKEVLLGLTRKGIRIQNNCTQPNIASDFDEWKNQCIRQLTRYVPNIQNKIEDSIKNDPSTNYCTKTTSIIRFLDSLK